MCNWFLRSNNLSCSRKPLKLRDVIFGTTLSVFATITHADYLATENLRIYPTPLTDITEGFIVGTEIEFLIEVTPKLHNANQPEKNQGHAAWSSFYVPPGAEIIAADYITASGPVAVIDAEDADRTIVGCSRGCEAFDGGDITGHNDTIDGVTVDFDDGWLNESQQDTGIFYSIDSRTAFVSAGLATPPTLEGKGANGPIETQYNLWDAQQTAAFGIGAGLANNNGEGNLPIVTTDAGTTWIGIGSPVAGPDTFYTNDYNPDCDLGGGDPGEVEAETYMCVGPWNRIVTPGQTMAGDVTETGTPASPGVPPALTVVRNITPAAAEFAPDFTGEPTITGIVLDYANPLPAATNAVRIVHGARRFGDIERWRLVLRVTDQTLFEQAIDDNVICADSIPGDTSNLPRGSADTNWKYHEVSHSCANIDSRVALVKEITAVNGDTNPPAGVQIGDVITYEFTLLNFSASTIENIRATDIGGENLTLLAEGSTDCPASYDGEYFGNPVPTDIGYFTGLSGGEAVWDDDNPPVFDNLGMDLDPNDSIKFTVCGEVTGGGSTSFAENTVGAEWDSCNALSAAQGQPAGESFCAVSKAISPMTNRISGHVWDETGTPMDDGTFEGDEAPISGVLISLYWDNGSIPGAIDGTDTLYATETTDVNGFYQFLGIAYDEDSLGGSTTTTARYIIVESQPITYTSTGDIDQTTPGTANCAVNTPTNNGCDVIARFSGANLTHITVSASSVDDDQDFYEVLLLPNLSVTKVDDAVGPISPGSTLIYTIEITNDGNVDAVGVVVDDPLPAGVTHVSTSTLIDGGAGGSCSAPAVVTCEFTTLEPGEVGSVTVEVTVN